MGQKCIDYSCVPDISLATNINISKDQNLIVHEHKLYIYKHQNLLAHKLKHELDITLSADSMHKHLVCSISFLALNDDQLDLRVTGLQLLFIEVKFVLSYS